MDLERYIQRLEERGELVRVTRPVSQEYEIAAILKALEPKPVLFENVIESRFRVVGNLLCTKAAFADYLGIETREMIPALIRAIEEHAPCEIVADAPCQEVVIHQPDLDELPILRHLERDGGRYITAGVFVAGHPKYGQNVDFHRCMQFSGREMAVRVVPGRDFDTFLQDLGAVDVAICVGNPLQVLVAAAISVEIGLDELQIANALMPLRVTRARTVDLLIPAEAEFVLEGTVYRDRRHAEGPFLDLTGTYDIVRQEPVLEVKAVTHRRNPLWHGLLPGGMEHQVLMGMPREPTIFRQVDRVARCLDVHIGPGGCSWLHAVVQIEKQSEEDGKRAIRAAFAGHRSCKHVFVVDEDIDIYDPLEVEWAMATRFQGDRDMVMLERAPGSSLDPSADPATRLTTRVGFDLTKPLGPRRGAFERVSYPPVDLDWLLGRKGE